MPSVHFLGPRFIAETGRDTDVGPNSRLGDRFAMLELEERVRHPGFVVPRYAMLERHRLDPFVHEQQKMWEKTRPRNVVARKREDKRPVFK